MLWFNELFFKPLENYCCKFCFKAVKKSRQRLQEKITVTNYSKLQQRTTIGCQSEKETTEGELFFKTVDRGRIFYLQHFRKEETKSTQLPYTNLELIS